MRIPAVAIAVLACSAMLAAQGRPYQAPRLPGTKHPDLNGLWQALNTAYWDIQDHSAQPAPVLATGAWGAIPSGRSVVEGNEIPYQEWALAKKQSAEAAKKTNAANRKLIYKRAEQYAKEYAEKVTCF